MGCTCSPPWRRKARHSLSRERPSIHLLKDISEQQYVQDQGQVRWKTAKATGARQGASGFTLRPRSPSRATNARRAFTWYKVHLTETCDEELPHLITNVQTTQAHITDIRLPAPIRACV